MNQKKNQELEANIEEEIIEQTMTPAIVVVAYNRLDSLKRLLSSLEMADYPNNESVPLIISIDRQIEGSNKEVFECAQDFVWPHGEKQVIYRDKNLGLKEHVLTCGDYAFTYGSVILLEDDLYVSPAFYAYAAEALTFTKDDDQIGGVSLYDHRLNVHVREPFAAIHDPYDNWYFQFASSWGQALTDKQWGGFREWLKLNDNKDIAAVNVPANVSSWSDKSWLKYHIKYLIDTNRYFMYPRISYTTNFAEQGTHARDTVNDLQVPLSGRRGDLPFRFSPLEVTRSAYDAFFENIAMRDELAENLKKSDDKEVTNEEICIDLYGYKTWDENTKYLLSSRALPYKRLIGYARRLRPIDENIFQKLNGNDFFLYDLRKKAEPPKINEISRLLYNYRAINSRNMWKIIKYRIRQKLKKEK